LALNSVTLDDLERQNRGFADFFRDMRLRKSLSFTRRRHRRQRYTRLWPMCLGSRWAESKWYAIFETITTELEML